MTVTVVPIPATHPPPPPEEPQTIKDIIKDIVKNPSDITNSILLSKKIIDIIAGPDRNYAWSVGDLLGEIKSQQLNNIREIINC